MTKFTVMKFMTYTGKPVWRILTDGCLATRDGAAGKVCYRSLERAEREAAKLNAQTTQAEVA